MNQATLTTEERKTLLETLRGIDPSRQELPRDCRRSRRRGVLAWMGLYLIPRDGTERRRVLRVMVKDVAEGGVGFFTRRAFKPDDRFVLPVRFSEGGGKLYLCSVVGCRKTSPRHYGVGAKFVDSVEDAHADAGIPSEWLRR